MIPINKEKNIIINYTLFLFLTQETKIYKEGILFIHYFKLIYLLLQVERRNYINNELKMVTFFFILPVLICIYIKNRLM